jgi:hypothetical protein
MANTAYKRVLDYAGCSLHRDQVDEMVVMDTRMGLASHTGTAKDAKGRGNIPGIIDTQDDNRPTGKAAGDWQAWPMLQSAPALTDTDHDGIPDDWETQIGLDPNNYNDGKMIHRKSGFSFLEIYMNSLVADIMAAGNEGGELQGSAQE